VKALLFPSLAAGLALAAAATAVAWGASPKVCAECVRANEARLAGDDLAGRACGSEQEHAAARFIADELKAYGVQGAAPDGGYLQAAPFNVGAYVHPPTLAAGGRTFTHGQDVLVLDAAADVSGLVALVALADVDAAAGKIAVFDAPFDPKAVGLFFKAGALAVVTQAPDQVLAHWDQLASRPPPAGGSTAGAPHTLIFARPEALTALRAADGQSGVFAAPRAPDIAQTTYNVLARLPGRGPSAEHEAILLTAHYDHLGVVGGRTYHGANDDASGTTAVMEFARMLGRGPAPRRTALFALFGCEEAGGHGARYFLSHPSAPLTDIAVNLEFEMIGAVDPRHPKSLMLTGWERSNLGPTLAAHGAAIGPDIDPDQHFFERSDNIQLARRGVVAQTVSAWPTPPTYHEPSDDLAHLDLGFMVHVIQSMAGPVDWLLNSDFKPAWNPGGQP
jgi:hypothetical protein